MSRFTESEQRLLRALEEPLPICERPFEAIARAAGWSEEDLLARLREWTRDGTIRRFGARVNHRRAGIAANAMSVWSVEEARIDEVGRTMAAQPEVSHCYHRPPQGEWPFNLYAMLHAKTKEALLEATARIAEATDIEDYDLLFSLKEFKKTAPRYFPEEPEAS